MEVQYVLYNNLKNVHASVPLLHATVEVNTF